METELTKAGYNIKVESKKMQNFYEDNWRNC